MNKVIIVLGPTGVGKTGIALLLAREMRTEIISADSMQIYRYMDIGTAKPSPAERESVKHHMIDIADPSESFSTGKYISMVTPILNELHKKDKIPLVVGGTGLYIKAMTRGIFSGPSADWTLREELLNLESEEKGSLYTYLKEVDPEAAGRITPKDTRRTIRALEVRLKSHENISEMQKRLTQPLPYKFIKIGLTRDRKELYQMIEERVDKMIEAGLLDEVKNLLRMHPDRTPLQAIGYKEIEKHLRGEISLHEAISLIKRGTKRYAKRQFTWFRKEEEIHWVDISGIHDSHEAFAHMKSLLESTI
jgi:tRNA dimethylallyltransferase